MARYWMYLNNAVEGPYKLEDLIRVRGFSRQTQVCIDDGSGTPTQWVSPAEIPELAKIFKVVDQVYEPSLRETGPKPIQKPTKSRTQRRLTAMPQTAESESSIWIWMWVVFFLAVAAGGFFHWYQIQRQKTDAQEQLEAQTLIETYSLPADSQYATLQRYFQEKHIESRWQFEHSPTGLYNVMLSWSPLTPGAVPLYSIEVNLQSQTIRGLNTAAVKLLTEGFPAPESNKPDTAAAPKKPVPMPALETVNERRRAVEQGDFEAVWKLFSDRKRFDMQRAGMSQSGFVRLQSLTQKVDAPIQQTLLKMKKDSDRVQWVLIRQTQDRHPDMFLKQKWVLEGTDWKLDDEEKKLTDAVPSEATKGTPSKPLLPVESLPGLSTKSQ